MNSIEREMVQLLQKMKELYGVIQIKAEFEAEGSRIEEMMRLKDVTTKAKLPIILKVGGAEAVTDIYNGVILGVEGIIAPMIETPYAAKKFLEVVKGYVQPDNQEDIEFAINIETGVAVDSIHDILELKEIDILSSITFGRSDFSRSIGLTKQDVDSNLVYDAVEKTAKCVKAKGLAFAVGGNITSNSIEFIKKLQKQNLLTKYETRKVVFHAEAVQKNAIEGIQHALEFELLWLKSKKRFYSKIKEEDEQRIYMLEQRLKI
jgi:hypothetical protein